jgi:hypothetical protein
MPKGEGTVLDNPYLLWLSSMLSGKGILQACSGRRIDGSRVVD